METTGLSPAYHHRVLEVAVVLVDDDGQLVYEWHTLVNPSRDVGASEIHGLTAADLHGAPTFDCIAGELGSLLQGRVPVAHNLAFDAAFLSAEFERLGHSVPLSRTNGLCTMRLAGLYLSGGRSLGSCCDLIGCPLESAHSALDDARGAARLLSHYIKSDRDFQRRWSEVVSAAQNSPWPTLPTSGATRVSRQHAAGARSQHFLGRLALRAPRSEVHPEANSYLAVLDRALLDRRLSLHEEDELVSVATMLGLSREDALRLHRLYFAALGRLAAEDGVVTPTERADLDLVAGMLGLTARDVEAAFVEREVDDVPVCGIGAFSLHQGDAVVFTGEAPNIERADLEYQARTLGLRPTSSVSKKTRLLVAADPDSLSGKARKARDLGLPIVGYATYFRMLACVRSQCGA